MNKLIMNDGEIIYNDQLVAYLIYNFKKDPKVSFSL